MKHVTKYGPWIAAFFAVALLVYGIVTVRNYQPPTEFSMATGAEGGAYHKYGLEYQRLLAEQGYTLHLVPTAGSKENLELLEEGMVDIALVQTSTAGDADIASLSSLGSLFYEPLWVFYRPEAGDDSIRSVVRSDGQGHCHWRGGRRHARHRAFRLAENGVTDDNATFHALSNGEARSSIDRRRIGRCLHDRVAGSAAGKGIAHRA